MAYFKDWVCCAVAQVCVQHENTFAHPAHLCVSSHLCGAARLMYWQAVLSPIFTEKRERKHRKRRASPSVQAVC